MLVKTSTTVGKIFIPTALALVLALTPVGQATAAVGDPNLVTDTTLISLTAPDTQIVEVYSSDLPLGTAAVVATSADVTVATVQSVKVTTGNIATFKVTAVAHGFTSITFALDGYNSLTLNVTINYPGMNSFPDSISGVTSGISVVEVSSIDQPFAPGTLIHADSLRPGVAILDTQDVEVGLNGLATFSIRGVARGMGTIQFSTEGYSMLAVSISIANPSLVATSSAVELVLGTSSSIDVLSVDVPLEDPSVVTVTASRDGVVDATNVPGDALDVAHFSLTGLAVGLTTLTFHAPGNSDSSQVVVNVVQPRLTVGPLPFTLGIGTTEYLEIDSPDVTLGSDVSLSAQSSDENVIVIGDVPLPVNGSVSIPIQIVGSGSAIVTISGPGFSSASIAIPVSIPSMEASDRFIQVAAGASTDLSFWSLDQSFPDGVTLYVTVDNPSVVTAPDSVDTVSGIAEISVSGEAVGSTTLRISADGYRPTSVVVRVVRSQLLTDLSDITLYAGETQMLTVSSDDFAIADESTISASSTGGNVLIGDPIIQGDGTVDFPITGVSQGRSIVTFEGPTFISTTSRITVVAPTLKLSVSDISVAADASKTVTINSDDFEIPDGTLITASVCDQGNVAVDDVPETWAGEATITINAIYGGTCIVTLSADSYASVSLRVTVPQPLPKKLTPIGFALRKSTLDAKSIIALDKAIETINRYHFTKVTLGGYQIVGDGAKGVAAAKLAQTARTNAVKAYFIAHLTTPVTFVAVDATSTAKKGFASTAKGRSTYRRVEITLGF